MMAHDDLAECLSARISLFAARRSYHLALCVADEHGVTHEAIAKRLKTNPLYVTNAIHKHRHGLCGCPQPSERDA